MEQQPDPSPAEAKKRAEFLRAELERHSRLYYVEAKPEISDRDFDRLMRELQELEAAHPELAAADSPTRRVGGEPLEGFRTVKHAVPMLSLGTAFEPEEVHAFDRRVTDTLRGAGMLGMFRIQGASQDFVAQPHAAVRLLGELRGEMGQIRQLEKDMIIHYEKVDAVRAAHAQWLAALGRAKDLAAGFEGLGLAGPQTLAQDIARLLDGYRAQFAHVARQLEEGGYDSATIANRMSTKAVAQFDEAAQIAHMKREMDEAGWPYNAALDSFVREAYTDFLHDKAKKEAQL